MQAVSDEQLIQWVADGDASCLGTLFERHHRGVYQYCLQLTRSPAASEDLVQDVFLRLLQKAASFRGDGSCKAWIFNIARNVTFDYLRRAERRTVADDDGDENAEHLVDHRSTEQVAAAEQNLQPGRAGAGGDPRRGARGHLARALRVRGLRRPGSRARLHGERRARAHAPRDAAAQQHVHAHERSTYRCLRNPF